MFMSVCHVTQHPCLICRFVFIVGILPALLMIISIKIGFIITMQLSRYHFNFILMFIFRYSPSNPHLIFGQSFFQ